MAVAEEGTGGHEVHFLDELEVNHTSPDLDTLIGYSSSLQDVPLQPSHAPGPPEHRAPAVLEVSARDTAAWGAEDAQASGYGAPRSSPTAAHLVPDSAPPNQSSAPPETDTGTDFGLLGNYGKDVEDETELQDDTGLTHLHVFTQDPTAPGRAPAPSRGPLTPGPLTPGVLTPGPLTPGVLTPGDLTPRALTPGPLTPGDLTPGPLTPGDLTPGALTPGVRQEEEREGGSEADEKTGVVVMPTIDPTPTVGFTKVSWDWPESTSPPPGQSSEVAGGGVTEVVAPERDFDDIGPEQQVVCIDWTELAGRGYVVLNMTNNLNCEEFRVDKGVRLLKTLERVFARTMNSPEGSWVLYLSKPLHQQRQLLMNVASEQGVIDTKDVLDMLGQIRKSLDKVGIQNYSSASSCHARPSQTRSDYGKLFVVLVIIGSVCTIIITSGFIYICWQRRLPAKTTFRAEELHFVENACHDNPTLDVANDNQGEAPGKKPSANGLQRGPGGGATAAGGGAAPPGEGAEEGRRWQVFVNEAATEEDEEEQDTHL